MRRIDVNTIILMTTILCMLLSLVLVMLRRSFPRSIKGLSHWAAGIGVSFAATALFATRGYLPDVISMALAHGVAYLSVYLFYRGSQRFLGVQGSGHWWAAGIGGAVLVLLWFTAVTPDYRVYSGWASFFMAAFFGRFLVLLVRQGESGFSHRFTAVVVLLQVLASLLRFVVTFLEYDQSGVMDANAFRAIYVATTSFSILGLSIGVILMATERLRVELERQAAHDPLTGALTRRAMTEACERELERFRRQGRVMSMLMIDIDHFKSVNDTYGHMVGDRVLVDFVTRVRQLLRRPDHLGRFGGEEFVVLLPETSLEEARTVAERIRAAAQGAAPGLPGYTVSIGVTVSRVEDAVVDVILKRADAALYQAKTLGRNRVEAA